MPLSNIGTWVAFAYAARDARCSSSQCSLIHPRFPSCTTGTLNRERIAAVVSPTKTPMMNHICSLAGTSPASRNPRRRQRRRRSLAESTGIATRRRSGLIRRLNVNLSCGNWPGVHSCCELVAQAVGRPRRWSCSAPDAGVPAWSLYSCGAFLRSSSRPSRLEHATHLSAGTAVRQAGVRLCLRDLRDERFGREQQRRD